MPVADRGGTFQLKNKIDLLPITHAWGTTACSRFDNGFRLSLSGAETRECDAPAVKNHERAMRLEFTLGTGLSAMAYIYYRTFPLSE